MIALTYMLALLILWSRRKSVLDLWLMVAVCALIAEIGEHSFVCLRGVSILAFMQIVRFPWSFQKSC